MHVLVMTVVLGFIGANVLRMLLQPALSAANAVNSAKRIKKAEASIAKVQSAWNANGATCSSGSGVACSPASGCDCTCSVAGSTPVESTSNGDGSCELTATPVNPD